MTIEERVQTLETELGRQRMRARTLLGVVLLAIGTAVAGFAHQLGNEEKVARANRFSLVDEQGTVRAMLSMSENNPALAMVDEKSKLRVLLSVSENGPRLSIMDDNGKVRASLGSLVTISPDGSKHISLESTPKLFGPDGNILWKAP
jgi:hypothetical protein